MMLSGGKDVIDFDAMSPDTKAALRKFAADRGQPPLPDRGVWTRQQYMDYAMRAQAAQQGGSGGGGQGGSGDKVEEILRDRMRQDRDGDGRISMLEADDKLKPNFEKIDTNRDGYVDPGEYRAYYMERFGGGSSGGGSGGGPGGDYGRGDQRREEPVVAIRYGKLPQGTPSMFTDMDTDKDAQIALYEWRTAGNDVKEFQTMDLNGDGLVTIEEYARYKRNDAEQRKIAAAEEGIEVPTGRPGGTGRPAFGGTGGGTTTYGKPNGSSSDARIIPGGPPSDSGPNPFRAGGNKPNKDERKK